MQPFALVEDELNVDLQMRTVLKTPVPRVFTWSSNAQNPIGAEYILMEKAAGIQLRYVWPPMDIKARLPVVKALARYQKLWSSTTFRGIGSLYYAEDMRGCKAVPCVYTNGKGEQIQDSRYMIGPCTGRKFSDDGRSVVSFDRGPCKSPCRIQVSAAHHLTRDVCRGVWISRRLSRACLH